MAHRLSELSTIIFDLGEVIVDLDTQAVLKEFYQLTGIEGSILKERLVNTSYLFEYETGQIDGEAFVQGMNEVLGTNIGFEDFKHAWNLMVKDIPVNRLEFIKELQKSHQILILSNTNYMHEEKFEQIMMERVGQTMIDFADVAYYSHHIGYRKPNHDIYEFVIEQNNLDPQKALFLDDREDNILAAKAVGLKAEQVLFPDQIFEILKND
ncbi:MAG: hypothetical protein CMB80_27100 [Flammeovirgaceae bacterium]|nr:hypothetical protein [Flammeovirgaceae bacterium]MBE62476.1 hypothetical protein [Flammeovirgaceae bacterium]